MLHAHNWLRFLLASPSGLIALRILWQALDLCFLFFRFFWCKLDFTDSENNGNFKMTHYHQNYGYSLEAALEKHSIKELETPKFKEHLMNSLKKGNIQSVTVVINGQEHKRFVEANPQFKTVKIYDAAMERINDRESKEAKKSESQSQSTSKETKKGQENEGDSEDSGGKKKQSRKRGASIS